MSCSPTSCQTTYPGCTTCGLNSSGYCVCKTSTPAPAEPIIMITEITSSVNIGDTFVVTLNPGQQKLYPIGSTITIKGYSYKLVGYGTNNNQASTTLILNSQIVERVKNDRK